MKHLMIYAAALAIAVGATAGRASKTVVSAQAQTGSQGRGSAQQPRPVLGPPIYELDDRTMLRWPLPASAPQYGKIDGFALKPYVNTLVAISEKSRKAGNQWWGRITGTPYYEETQTWIEQQFRKFGVETRRQAFELPPVWFPQSWELSASSGGRAVALKTAQPTLRSPGTSERGIDADAVYVGLGSPAELKRVDVKGKVAFVYSTPTPSALRHSASTDGTMRRLQESGAAAVVMILGLPGNVTTQLWGSHGEEQTLDPVPTFSIGSEDGLAVQRMLESDQPVKVHVALRVQTRTGLKPEALWGVLPGATDENILIMAHPDGFFQGGLDNASGVAVMLGLAEYFSGIPKERRRRTITFLSTVGHHVSKDVGLLWMHDNMKEFWSRAVLIINAEHVATTQVYRFDRLLVRSNAATAHRFFVGGNKTLHDILFNDFSLFGMGLYAAPQVRPSGDLIRLVDMAPGIEVIESNEFYHSDLDDNAVPAVGLEGIARAYAKIVDDVNQLDRSQLVAPAVPGRSGAAR
jgi:peptidase M28-like protein